MNETALVAYMPWAPSGNGLQLASINPADAPILMIKAMGRTSSS